MIFRVDGILQSCLSCDFSVFSVYSTLSLFQLESKILILHESITQWPAPEVESKFQLKLEPVYVLVLTCSV